MSELYKRIENMCKEKGTSITEMCKESGVARSSLTDLKMGRIKGLNAKTLERIADYFGVSVDYVLGKQSFIDDVISKAIQATADRKKPADQMAGGLMSTKYLQLNAENRAVIDSLIEKLLKSQPDE